MRPSFPHRATSRFGLLNVPVQSLKHFVPGNGKGAKREREEQLQG